jgi:hypothetical protein
VEPVKSKKLDLILYREEKEIRTPTTNHRGFKFIELLTYASIISLLEKIRFPQSTA